MPFGSDAAREEVRRWTAAHPRAVLYDDESATLLDVSSGKSLKLSWPGIQAFEKKAHPETGDAYLVLLLENGVQIALVDPGGVAFVPSTVNSGPVVNLPAVMCLRDFLVLKQRIDHYLHEHSDEPPPRECADMVMMCIAVLDGARAVGFDVGDLERELESSVNELERRSA